MFSKILIANRGEIACRIIQTANKLNIKTVAVYSAVDQNAQHVQLADEAYCIGPATAHESYLSIEKIIKVAKETNANAIHPGYGFLSENDAFATACEENNITFIGPPSDVIKKMGSKAQAKLLMEQAKVPLIPGYHGDNQDPKLLLKHAKTIGFPVLIKASFGGGGKGMRLVYNEKEFISALAACSREATANFGNDHLILEKFIENPRHIEVQIFGDHFGNIVHLFERDCSIQRRHQKIIEEAPANNLNDNLRKKIGQTAIQAAKSIGYVGAGTIEFLLDKNNNFYFMEMNTRLQVEHPVTEMITEQDLVSWQIRVAAKMPLPLSQDQISISGHSIEARIYAEDPSQDFLPITGTIKKILTPILDQNTRFDSGVCDKDTISIHYDPMLAKLIVKSKTREQAIIKMQHALKELMFAGITTNLPYLRKVATQKDFIQGNVDTDFISKNNQALSLKISEHTQICALAIAAMFNIMHRQDSQSIHSPWHETNGWRLNVKPEEHMSLFYHGVLHEIKVSQTRNTFLVIISSNTPNQTALSGKISLVNNNVFNCIIKDDSSNTIFSDHVFAIHHDDGIYLCLESIDYNFALPSQGEYIEHHDSHGALTAPMPGIIRKILVKAGTTVSTNDPLLIIEAMKMEHTIKASEAGIVSEVHFNEGDTVEEGIVLLDIKEPV